MYQKYSVEFHRILYLGTGLPFLNYSVVSLFGSGPVGEDDVNLFSSSLRRLEPHPDLQVLFEIYLIISNKVGMK